MVVSLASAFHRASLIRAAAALVSPHAQVVLLLTALMFRSFLQSMVVSTGGVFWGSRPAATLQGFLQQLPVQDTLHTKNSLPVGGVFWRLQSQSTETDAAG